MPVIEILPFIHPKYFWDCIYAEMLFPHDREMRNLYIFNALINAGYEIQNSAYHMQKLAKFGIDRLEDESFQAQAPASTTGMLLCYIAKLAKYEPELASKNKAKALVYLNHASSTEYNVARKAIPVSSGTLDTYWAKYKDVAHYWAALQIAFSSKEDFSTIETKGFRTPNSLGDFIDISWWFYNFGTSFKPIIRGKRRAVDSILSTKTSIAPPLKIQNVETVALHPLTDREEKALRKYSSRQV